MSHDMLTAILRHCLADANKHQKLLNTFALMENIGAQKIHRFQRFGFTSEFVLRHAAEEARHALFFKSKARLLGETVDVGFDPERTLASSISRGYLRRLDILVNRYIKTKLARSRREQYMLAYLLSTLLIERRANEIYPKYEELLREQGSPISLRSIIAEEGRHLHEMEELLFERIGEMAFVAIDELQRQEASIYQTWLLAVGNEASAKCPIC